VTDEQQRIDQERFAALYRTNHRLLLAFALRRVGDVYAQDVVAETFLAAWRHLDRAPAQPLPWLYCIAGNAIANHRRSQLRQARLQGRLLATDPGSGAAPGNTSIDYTERIVEADRVAAALRRLSPGDQEVLRLSVWEDLSVTDAATALDCSTTALKVRLHRARRRFAQLLGPDPSHDQPAPEQGRSPASRPASPPGRASAEADLAGLIQVSGPQGAAAPMHSTARPPQFQLRPEAF